MTTQELLDELRNNILRDSSGNTSGTSDRLWSDDTLMRYINEAYYRFCRLTLSLVDRTTPAVVEILTEAEVENYDLHASILALFSARLEDDTTDLGRTGHGILDGAYRPDDTPYFDVNVLAAMPPGKPLAVTTDEDAGTLRLYPAPSADYADLTLSLRVARLPLEKLSLDRPDESPEIREEWHLGMLDWAAGLALSNQDADGEDLHRANSRKKAFGELVAEVQRETRRRRFAGTAWSFGQLGFASAK